MANKYQQPGCPKCKSKNITVDNIEQDGMIFRDKLKNATALFIEGKCDKCGQNVVVHYHAMLVERAEE